MSEEAPLVAAVQSGDVGRARELVRAGHVVDAAGPGGMTALHVAVLAEDLAMAALLVNEGARVDLPIVAELEDTGGYLGPGVTALSLAARVAQESAGALAWDALRRLGARCDAARIADLRSMPDVDALVSQLPSLCADATSAGDAELLAALITELEGSDVVLAASRAAQLLALVERGPGASEAIGLDRERVCGRWEVVGVCLRDGWFHGRETLADLGWGGAEVELLGDETYRAVLFDGALREGRWTLDGEQLALDGVAARFDRYLARLEVDLDRHARAVCIERA